MKPEVAVAALRLIQRVDLKGDEVDAFVQIRSALVEIANSKTDEKPERKRPARKKATPKNAKQEAK